MKVAYISNLPFADADFPLIREMQIQGVEVDYFIYVTPYSHKATLANIQKLYPRQGILPVTVYKEFLTFKNYLNLKKVYVVNSLHRSDFHPANLKTMLELLRRVWKYDVIHLTWPPRRNKLLFYFLRRKIVLTLHDPFPHSDKNCFEFELCRILAFKWISKIVLLNEKQKKLFVNHYHIPERKVFLSRLGKYDCIRYVVPSNLMVPEEYVLFFGLIAPYKGIEYLLRAFERVHENFPKVKLLIVGSGKLYFDASLYRDKAYVEIWNRYISLNELSALLSRAKFTVCPYKDATQSGVVQTAFSMGLPVVATDVGNFSDIVQEGKTGRIVPPNDVSALVDAMSDLLNNPSGLEQMRVYIENEWGIRNEWAPIVKQYLNVYSA